ncbi:aminotransferase class I/II-fold pyridoxal phosphate-dependent enzyme [Streptomyces sp. NPDC018007]|uniref:aminotransferase class I/II-fold pyridoxal phosphate-dependent enzyme n=1 Tax=Streptomyces sp. NPDC018007 TaxID=3365029 RepID=UPI00378E1ABB
MVYLGSFAKTVLPGARVGYAVADQRVHDAQGATGLFADQLSKIKSMVTVNTSPIAQAVVGGALLENAYSLDAANGREREAYRRNLRQVVEGLEARVGNCPGVSWNTPAGGFFVCVTVPFTADDELLELSARRFGVLWTPMCHFYSGPGGSNELRLSVSSLTGAEIKEGLDRLAALFAGRGCAPVKCSLCTAEAEPRNLRACGGCCPGRRGSVVTSSISEQALWPWRLDPERRGRGGPGR